MTSRWQCCCIKVNHKQQANSPRERRGVTSRYHGDKIMIWILTIFLDKDGHLHCRTMEEKYGILFCSWVQACTGKEFMFFVLSVPWTTVCSDFATMATWRNDFSSSVFFWFAPLRMKGHITDRYLSALFPSNKHLSDKAKHLEISRFVVGGR